MLFNQLKANDTVHVLEITGTFKKNTSYSLGTVTQVSPQYDEPLPQGQFPIPGQVRKKLIDLTVNCDGESKKLTVQADKSIINDAAIGLTLSTDKDEIVNMIKNRYNECKAKKEAIARYDEEMSHCEQILEYLGQPDEQPTEMDTLKKELAELKELMKQKVD